MTNLNPHPQNQWWLMCKVMPAIFPSFKLERGHALIFHFKCSRLMVGYLLKQSLKLISKCPWSYPSSYTHTYSLSNRGGAILIASGPGHMGKQSYRAWNPALSHGSSYREELKNQGMRLLSFDKHMYNVLSHFFFHFYTKTLWGALETKANSQ